MAKKAPRVKAKKSKVAHPDPSSGDKRGWAEESPDPSPKRLFSLFSLEGAIDNSGFLPTRAQREETEDDLFAL